MPCSNSITFKIDFNFAAAAMASAIVRLELNIILDISENEPLVMSKEKLRKVLGLVESIVSVARCTFTPFHLGLAIELYHEYGSPSCTNMIPSGAKVPFSMFSTS
jgi:hypothetical protein